MPTILQTHQWVELKSAFGWSVFRHQSEGCMAQLLLRRTPLGRLAYIPRGPALNPEPPRDAAMRRSLAELRDLGQNLGLIALKVEPPWPDDASTAALLRHLGFCQGFQCVQPRSTVLIDISGSEDDILSCMKSKTRYNIRLAARKGVAVRAAPASDISAFTSLLHETAGRDGFAIHPPAYYRTALDLFEPAGMAALLLAEYNGEILAGIMLFAFAGTCYYFYGASSSRRRDLMPTYALQWAGIRWARDIGCRYYDLWGIPDEVGQEPEAYMSAEVPARKGLWGVWRFKRGFGGQVVRYVGAWDYVYKPLAYRMYHLYYQMRRRGHES